MRPIHTAKSGFSGWMKVDQFNDVKLNAGYVSPCVNNDPSIRAAMTQVLENMRTKYPENQEILLDTKCVNLRQVNAQVVMCDVEIWAKITTKKMSSYKIDQKVSPRKQIKSDKYLITFIDEDGDTSEEAFEGSENGLVEVLYRNYHKFGLKLHSLKRNGRKVNTKNGCFEIDNYRFSIA